MYWDDYEKEYQGKNTCPNCLGSGLPGYHDAKIHLAKSSDLENWTLGGEPEQYEDSRWPVKCDHCPALVPNGSKHVTRQILRTRFYNTESGDPEPGDLYLANWYRLESGACFYWENCSGPHLLAVLPNKRVWDISSRARNCTLLDDHTHRCWVVRGDPPDITVGKDGPTCGAGAGSIQIGDFHGFLRNGIFVPC